MLDITKFCGSSDLRLLTTNQILLNLWIILNNSLLYISVTCVLGSRGMSKRHRRKPYCISLIARLVNKIIGYMGNRRSPIAKYEELEKAVTSEWILNTAKVKDLNDFTPR